MSQGSLLEAQENRLDRLVDRLLRIAREGLPHMFRRDKEQFAFTRRRSADGHLELDGESRRYGAIVVLGASRLAEGAQRSVFGGATASEFCGRMLSDVRSMSNLGDVALLAWAAAELGHRDLSAALERMRELGSAQSGMATIEAAWVLSALSAAHEQAKIEADLVGAHTRLIHSFNADSRLFPQWIRPQMARRGRSHVTCFADQVFPIHALARYHKVFGDQESVVVAERCAEQICRQQGSEGQWWWHYDVRTGSVVEGYPVYSVHQDAMGPMALRTLAEAGGTDHGEAIRLGLSWLERAPEASQPLIECGLKLVWRKVGRSDPWKMVRAARATASRVHPNLRLRPLNSIFRPTQIDYECRPYHLGWILYTWQGGWDFDG